MDQPNIYAAICNVMADVGAIGKDSRNKQQGFAYRGIDAVLNALQPAMVKHHVFVAPEVLEQTREERHTKSGTNLLYSVLKVRYTFYTDDGSSVSATVVGEGMDSGDKASNKAMSAALKYACFQLFCIPTEEMHDPDAETPEQSHSAPDGDSKIDKARQKVLCATIVKVYGKEHAQEQMERITGHAKSADVTHREYDFAMDVIAKEAKRAETGV